MNRVSRVRALPFADGPVPEPVRDREILAAYAEDASGRPPGAPAGLLRPAGEAEIAAFLRATAGRGVRVLPQAARSSLTGGAIPQGEVVISVERLTEGLAIGGGRARVAAGVRLRDLQAALAERGAYFPPVPTYQEAMIGGAASTNAGGAATFKYGTARDWVRAVRVVLANGAVVAVERGEAVARRGEAFEIEMPDGTVVRVPTPVHRLPDVRKLSAGYHAAEELDLVDLFVGSEGTLGVFTEITVDVIELPAAVLAAIAFVGSERVAMALAADLRTERGGRGVDVRAVEVVDGRSLDLVRAHGETARLKIGVPAAARSAVFVEAELPVACTGEQALEALGRYLEGEAAERGGMLFALFERLQAHDALDDLLLAMPDDPARRAAFAELREAVPKRVNEILAGRRRDDPGIRKVGGDLIVPFERLPEMWEVYEHEFEARGLEFAIWGHLSDGNLHPNVLARSAAEVEAGEQALLMFADLAIRLGGSPLSEHGVGRSVLKQEMLRRLVGEAGLEGMRAVKSALDPEWRMAPGVLLGVKS